jgi:hypothetical protein
MATPHGLEAAAGPDRLWQARYLKCRENYRSAKATIRQQATKSRQLIAAVTDQLTKKDDEIKQVNRRLIPALETPRDRNGPEGHS